MGKKPQQNQRFTESQKRTPHAKRIDWARVEADFCTGQWTDIELGCANGIGAQTICRRKMRDRKQDPSRWARDQSGNVARAREAMLLAPEAIAAVKPGAVLAAAIAGADVIRRHRRDLGVAQDVAMRLLGELDAVSVGREQIEQLLRVVTAGIDPAEAAGLREQVKALVKLHARTASLAKLADSMQKFHSLERKAFGIEDSAGGQDPAGKSLSDVERAARLLAIIARARAAREAAEPSAPGAPGGDPAAPGEHPAPLH